MKPKRINPYQMLHNDIVSWIRKLRCRRVVGMFFWPADKLTSDKVWRLDDVYQRTMAAKSLGYEVVLEVDEKGMAMKYRKVIEIPTRWQP